MPEIVSEIVFSVSAVTGGDVVATVNVQGTDADDVIATATVDGTAGEAAQASVSQRVNLAVSVAGSEVQPTNLLGNSEVSRTYESLMQTGRFGTPLSAGGVGLFGSPFDSAGPPTGLRTISIYGVYETSTGRHLVPIITDGIADTSERTDQGGYVESFEFADRGARFDRKKVSVIFPPGHGLNRDEVASNILIRADEDRNRLEPMAQMMKELQLSKAEPVNEIQGTLMDIEHRRLLWDREGYPINPRIGPLRADEPVRWSFTASDLLDAEAVNVRHIGDVITKVIATGNAQEILGTCDPLTDPRRLETHAIYAAHRPAFAQGTGSVYTPQDPEEATDTPILVELKIIETTRRCETVVRQRTIGYSWYNPESVRYSWDATNDEWDTLSNVFAESDADDDSPAYDRFAEGWLKTTVEDLRHYYFQKDFQLPWSPGQYPELRFLQFPIGVDSAETDADGTILGPLAGVKLGTWRLAYSYYNPRTALKDRSVATLPYDDWLEVEPDNGKMVLGNKEAVQGLIETLRLVSEDIELVQSTDDGKFLILREIHSHGWDVRPGGAQFFFNEDVQSNEEDETYRKVQLDTEAFVAEGDEQHNVIRNRYDRDGREIDGAEDEFGNPSYLPAMDRLQDTAPDESLYQNDTDVVTKSREALRVDQRQIKVEVEATDLLDSHEENEVEASLEWAENEEELEYAARMMIVESAVAKVSFTLAGFNAFIQETERVHLEYSPLGIDHDLRVVKVAHSGGYPDGPLLTRLDCNLYGWD